MNKTCVKNLVCYLMHECAEMDIAIDKGDLKVIKGLQRKLFETVFKLLQEVQK